jgi:hypothetical protein
MFFYREYFNFLIEISFIFPRGNASDGYYSKDWSHYGFPMLDTNSYVPFKDNYFPEFQYETDLTQLPTQISVEGYYYSFFFLNSSFDYI